jgi:hypothetical protein
MILYPFVVRRAVLNELNPLPGLTNHFIPQGFCSTIFFGYLLGRKSTVFGKYFSALSLSIVLDKQHFYRY